MTPVINVDSQEQVFYDAYVKAIYWTDTGDKEQPSVDAPLDPDFLRASLIDCLSFFQHVRCFMGDDLAMIEQAGIDFWLTRNLHGSGFWDKSDIYGDYTKLFDETAEKYSEVWSEFLHKEDMQDGIK